MRTIAVGMIGAIVCVVSLAYWDAQHESDAALRDFGNEQTSIANSLAAALGSELVTEQNEALTMARLVHGGTRPMLDAGAASSVQAARPDDAPVRATMHDGDSAVHVDVPMNSWLAAAKAVERPGDVVVLLRRPNRDGLVDTTGKSVHLPTVEAGLAAKHADWIRLSKDEAKSIGLPARIALAGLAHFRGGAGSDWGVTVIESARRERDREIRAQWRLVLGVSIGSGLVFLLGIVAFLKQRKEAELARELAIAEATRARDERLGRADKAATMGALAMGIAHEVSTPLTVIMGLAEQLGSKLGPDARAHKAVGIIQQEVERIHAVIRGFLNLARGGSAPMQHVDPRRLATRAAGLVEHRFVEAGVTLKVDAPTGLADVNCEPLLFEQVLVNLLLNACDACEPGGRVELRVRLEGERITFVVADNGTGITPEAARRATEPFFSTKADQGGTGLGLAISSEIVKHHRGILSITPASAENVSARGTNVRVEIPAAGGKAMSA